MAPTVSQILVLLALAAASTQRKLHTELAGPSDDDLINIVEHLKSHALNPANGAKTPNNAKSLLNVETLNLYLKKDRKSDQYSRAGDQNDDRICAKKRCGCGGCGRQGEEEGEVNEVQQILDELERELDRNGPLRCPGGYRCGRSCCGGRYRADEDVELRFEDDDDDGEDQLRCRYGRCGSTCCGRSDYNDNGVLRCEYGRCGGGCCGRAGKTTRGSDLKSKLEHYGRKYKINDDVEAIVVDLSKFHNVVQSLTNTVLQNADGDRNDNKDRISMDYIFGDARSVDNRDERSERDSTRGNEESLVTRMVNEILLKVSKANEDPVRPNELVNFYLEKKRRVLGNALNFVKNSLGPKDLNNLTGEQKFQLQKLRAQVQRLGGQADSNGVEKAVVDIVLGEGSKSEVLPHNEKSNNVYVPAWVHKAVKDSRADLRRKRQGKSLFPLTNKQRQKLYTKSARDNSGNYWRRDLGKNVENYGVPFQLEIQGLGQVNP